MRKKKERRKIKVRGDEEDILQNGGIIRDLRREGMSEEDQMKGKNLLIDTRLEETIEAVGQRIGMKESDLMDHTRENMIPRKKRVEEHLKNQSHLKEEKAGGRKRRGRGAGLLRGIIEEDIKG